LERCHRDSTSYGCTVPTIVYVSAIPSSLRSGGVTRPLVWARTRVTSVNGALKSRRGALTQSRSIEGLRFTADITRERGCFALLPPVAEGPRMRINGGADKRGSVRRHGNNPRSTSQGASGLLLSPA